jgi:hypothetical protein
MSAGRYSRGAAEPGPYSGRQRLCPPGMASLFLVLIALAAASGLPFAGAAAYRVLFYIRPLSFSNAGPEGRRPVLALTSLMNEIVVVKFVAVERGSNALAVSERFSVPFTLAPGETYQLPVTLNVRKGRGTARLRVVASSEKHQTDVVEFVKFHYVIR